MRPKRIGIIGSGVVAFALAEGFKKYGYDIMLGSSDLSKLAKWDNWCKGSFEETAKFGDIIVLAVKGLHWKSALTRAGLENLEDKVVIDVTNPISETPPVNGVLNFFTGPNESLMEMMQNFAPKVRFVKAFSCVGSHFMVNPDFDKVRPTMFICGNDEQAKHDVDFIVSIFGWECQDMGMVESARAIEPLCILWCLPGLLSNSWSHAFKLLKK